MRLILIFLFLPIIGFSQTLRVSDYNQNNSSIKDSLWFTSDEYFTYSLGNLNFQEVLNNGSFLIEKSQNPFLPNSYDGLNNDDTILSPSAGLNIYSRFYNSYLGSTHPYRDVPSLVAGAEPLLNSGIVPIFLINHQYFCLKPNALAEGLVITNTDSTILYDNAGRTSSPFQAQRLFIGGAYVAADTYHSTGEVVFSISSDFIVTDMPSTEILIDFGDGGGYNNVSIGQKKTVNYGSSGLKTITIRQGNRECKSQFNFVRDVIFQGSTESASISQLFRSNVAGASTFTQLGCDGLLNKPVLIVEGLAIAEDLSAQYIFDSFDNSNSNFLLTRLREQNYDIIVVKFANNNGSIISNAKVLENVINDINSKKSGTEKLDIIGLSMGGLIVKYCLKDMEDRSISHNVKNYFSYDAPHQGAYVPFGLQILLENASYAVKSIREDPLVSRVSSVLNSSAAKQLLEVSKNMGERNSFATVYSQKGYPINCKNFGIANGRGDGVGLSFGGGAQLMDFYAQIRVSILGRVLGHTQKLWAVNTSNSNISYFQNRGLAAILGMKGLKAFSSRGSYTGVIPHEAVPGSHLSTVALYGEGLKTGFRNSGDSDPDLNLFGIQNVTFVPTVSALDLNNQNYGQNGIYIPRNPFFNIQSGNVVANHITPFDDVIFGAGVSGEHLDVTPQIADFIMLKIYGAIPQITCSSGCITNAPTFTTIVANTPCHDQDVIMNNYPPGVSIQWTVPVGVKLLYGQGTNKIRINSTKSGINNLSVSIRKPDCTPFVYNVPVNIQQEIIGKPSYIVGELPYVCRFGNQIYRLNPVAGATSYQWYTNYGEIIGSTNGTEIEIDFSGAGSGPENEAFQLFAHAVNECGMSEATVVTGYLRNCHSRWAVFPNPANTEVLLKAEDRSEVEESSIKKTSANKQKIGYEMSVLNDKGVVLKYLKGEDTNSDIKMNVADIPNGIYFLHIKEGKSLIKRHLVIQH